MPWPALPVLPARIEVAGRTLPLLVRRSAAARRLTLRACAVSGSVRLTLPARLPAAAALRFLDEHRAWLEREVEARFLPPAPFLPGGGIRLADEGLRLAAAPVRRVVRSDQTLLVPASDPVRFNAAVLAFARQQARRTLAAEAQALAASIGRSVERVRIGDPTSRWGSCSARGHLAFSWRLILAPGFVRRAVVAHEVAHLVHLDHGPAFHALAGQLSEGAHRPARDWLRAHGAGLLRLGRFS